MSRLSDYGTLLKDLKAPATILRRKNKTWPELLSTLHNLGVSDGICLHVTRQILADKTPIVALTKNKSSVRTARTYDEVSEHLEFGDLVLMTEFTQKTPKQIVVKIFSAHIIHTG